MCAQHGAEVVERLSGRLPVHRGALDEPGRLTCVAEHHPRLGGLVRGADVDPGSGRPLAVPDRLHGIALGERCPTLRQSGSGAERWTREAPGDLAESVGRCRAVPTSAAATAISTCAPSSGASRSAPYGGRSFDGTSNGLSIASAISAAAPATSPCASRSSASPGCGIHELAWAARKASSAPVRSPLRSRMLPSSVSGHPNSLRIHGRSSSQASSASSSARVARAGQPVHLRSVHPTTATEPAECGVVAPVLHRLGPLPRPLVHGQTLHSADQFAVGHPRGHVVDPAGHQRQRDVVEDLETLGGSAFEDEEPGRRHPPDQDGRFDAVAPAEFDRRPSVQARGSPCPRTTTARRCAPSRPPRGPVSHPCRPRVARRGGATHGSAPSIRCRSSGTLRPSRRLVRPAPPRRR